MSVAVLDAWCARCPDVSLLLADPTGFLTQVEKESSKMDPERDPRVPGDQWGHPKLLRCSQGALPHFHTRGFPQLMGRGEQLVEWYIPICWRKRRGTVRWNDGGEYEGKGRVRMEGMGVEVASGGGERLHGAFWRGPVWDNTVNYMGDQSSNGIHF